MDTGGYKNDGPRIMAWLWLAIGIVIVAAGSIGRHIEVERAHAGIHLPAGEWECSRKEAVLQDGGVREIECIEYTRKERGNVSQ